MTDTPWTYSMIERVARAIHERDYAGMVTRFGQSNVLGATPFSALPEARQRQFSAYARAAIAAMREPTQRMESAGRDALLPWLPGGRIAKPASDQWQVAREIYIAAIDAALEGK